MSVFVVVGHLSRAIAADISSVQTADDIARLVKKHTGRSY